MPDEKHGGRTPEYWFLNHYRCLCGCAWTDEWSCMCDDRCPECDRSCSPFHSDYLTTDDTVMPAG